MEGIVLFKFEQGELNVKNVNIIGRLKPHKRSLLSGKLEIVKAGLSATRLIYEKLEKVWKDNRRKLKHESYHEIVELTYRKSRNPDNAEQ
jgi:hypothetical protein